MGEREKGGGREVRWEKESRRWGERESNKEEIENKAESFEFMFFLSFFLVYIVYIVMEEKSLF